MPTEEVSRGVCYIAYGWRAVKEAGYSIATLRQHNDLPVTVIGERINGAHHIEFGDNGIGRWAKVNLDRLSPYDYTLYLDADTRVHGPIGAGFDALHGGWDISICPSTKQGSEALWHVDAEERTATYLEVGANLLQLQGGVFFFRKSPQVHTLFAAWREEWQKWRGQDQAALLRALHRRPVRLWLLDNDWNGGALIEHRYGAARRRDGEV